MPYVLYRLETKEFLMSSGDKCVDVENAHKYETNHEAYMASQNMGPDWYVMDVESLEE